MAALVRRSTDGPASLFLITLRIVTANEIRRRFPNASSSCLLANIDAGELWKMYLDCKSIHQVGKLLGVCGETARKKLLSAGYRLNSSKWEPDELVQLTVYYAETKDSDFSIATIADQLKRSFYAVAIKAHRIGLTDRRTAPKTFSDRHRSSISKSQKRRFAEHPESLFDVALYMRDKENGFAGYSHGAEQRKKLSEASKKWHLANGHPRGMLGKKHTQEVCDAISKANSGRSFTEDHKRKILETKLKKYGTLIPNRYGTSWKSGWVEIGGKRFFSRSSWEVKYANRLELLKKAGEIVDWFYEPETFWFKVKRGTNNYTPDFKVLFQDGRVEFHEVKGWMDARSLTKIKRMRIYHPKVTLVVRDGEWFKKSKLP